MICDAGDAVLSGDAGQACRHSAGGGRAGVSGIDGVEAQALRIRQSAATRRCRVRIFCRLYSCRCGGTMSRNIAYPGCFGRAVNSRGFGRGVAAIDFNLQPPAALDLCSCGVAHRKSKRCHNKSGQSAVSKSRHISPPECDADRNERGRDPVQRIPRAARDRPADGVEDVEADQHVVEGGRVAEEAGEEVGHFLVLCDDLADITR